MISKILAKMSIYLQFTVWKYVFPRVVCKPSSSLNILLDIKDLFQVFLQKNDLIVKMTSCDEIVKVKARAFFCKPAPNASHINKYDFHGNVIAAFAL